MDAIKKISEYVSQLRRVGKGHGKNKIRKDFVHDCLIFSVTQEEQSEIIHQA